MHQYNAVQRQLYQWCTVSFMGFEEILMGAVVLTHFCTLWHYVSKTWPRICRLQTPIHCATLHLIKTQASWHQILNNWLLPVLLIGISAKHLVLVAYQPNGHPILTSKDHLFLLSQRKASQNLYRNLQWTHLLVNKKTQKIVSSHGTSLYLSRIYLMTLTVWQSK